MKLRYTTNAVKSRTKSGHQCTNKDRKGAWDLAGKSEDGEPGEWNKNKGSQSKRNIRSRSSAHGQGSPNRVTRGQSSTREYPIFGFALVALHYSLRKLQLPHYGRSTGGARKRRGSILVSLCSFLFNNTSYTRSS
jgi:hypothetical protein